MNPGAVESNPDLFFSLFAAASSAAASANQPGRPLPNQEEEKEPESGRHHLLSLALSPHSLPPSILAALSHPRQLFEQSAFNSGGTGLQSESNSGRILLQNPLGTCAGENISCLLLSLLHSISLLHSLSLTFSLSFHITTIIAHFLLQFAAAVSGSEVPGGSIKSLCRLQMLKNSAAAAASPS